MPFCPSCRTEYRPGVTKCVHCDKDLVVALPEADAVKSERLRAAVKEDKAARIFRAAYNESCQMVEFLQSQGLDSMVTGDPESCGKGNQCSHFFVSVLPEDVPAAAEIMRDEQKRLLDSDDECRGADLDAMVDLDAEGQKTCPACGFAFDGTPEECPDCGIFLGTPT